MILIELVGLLSEAALSSTHEAFLKMLYQAAGVSMPQAFVIAFGYLRDGLLRVCEKTTKRQEVIAFCAKLCARTVRRAGVTTVATFAV